MAEYTNDDHIEIEGLPKGISVDGIGDNLPEGGDEIKVPLMENGEPYPADITPEDPNPDGPDTSAEDDDDPYDGWDAEADWYDDEGEEGSSDRDDEEAAESDPRNRFYEFANISVGFFNSLSSILSDKDLQKLSFGVNSGDLGAFFSIERK